MGALSGLAALGLSLVFGVLKILNVAHGELIMIGGYATFWVFRLAGIDPFVALAIVIPILLLIGVLLHLGLFSRVVQFDEEHRIKNSLLIGFGLTLGQDGTQARSQVGFNNKNGIPPTPEPRA